MINSSSSAFTSISTLDGVILTKRKEEDSFLEKNKFSIPKFAKKYVDNLTKRTLDSLDTLVETRSNQYQSPYRDPEVEKINSPGKILTISPDGVENLGFSPVDGSFQSSKFVDSIRNTVLGSPMPNPTPTSCLEPSRNMKYYLDLEERSIYFTVLSDSIIKKIENLGTENYNTLNNNDLNHLIEINFFFQELKKTADNLGFKDVAINCNQTLIDLSIARKKYQIFNAFVEKYNLLEGEVDVLKLDTNPFKAIFEFLKLKAKNFSMAPLEKKCKDVLSRLEEINNSKLMILIANVNYSTNEKHSYSSILKVIDNCFEVKDTVFGDSALRCDECIEKLDNYMKSRKKAGIIFCAKRESYFTRESEEIKEILEGNPEMITDPRMKKKISEYQQLLYDHSLELDGSLFRQPIHPREFRKAMDSVNFFQAQMHQLKNKYMIIEKERTQEIN